MEEIITVNKTIWSNDIEKMIAEQKEFANSAFCNTAEDKSDALRRVKELEEILLAIKNDCLTSQMFDRIRYSY